jgi:hypothetical protein
MAEHLLDDAEVFADFVEGHRDGSPQVVKPEVGFYSGFFLEALPCAV